MFTGSKWDVRGRKDKHVFTPDHHTFSTRSFLAQRLMTQQRSATPRRQLWTESGTDADVRDNLCTHRPSVGAHADLLSTLPSEAVLDEAARELPRVVAFAVG